MPTNEVILLKNQAGIEVTRGTAVAATRKVYADITPSIDRTLNWGRSRTGTYDARRRPSYSRIRPTFSGVDSATYEDLAWWGQLMWKGGVTGVTDGGTPPGYTYTFLPTLATDDLKSITLEFNEAGNPMESSQVMVTSWTLRGDADNDQESEWMLDLEMMGRDFTTGITYTAALGERTTEAIIARGTKVYVDDATMGSTQLTGKLINWSITGNNNIHFKAFAEDENAFAANKVGRGERTVDAQFTFEFDDADELDNFLSTTPVERLIRLEREGTTIHTTTKKRLRTDLAGFWSSWSRSDREGNLTAVFGLQAGYNTTLAGSFKAEIVNALASLV